MKTIGIILRDYEIKNGGIVYGVRSYLIEKLKNYNVSIVWIPFDFENNNQGRIDNLTRKKQHQWDVSYLVSMFDFQDENAKNKVKRLRR